MQKIVFKQVNVVNEGTIRVQDVLIAGERIEKIANSINPSLENVKEFSGNERYLLPGLIDDHVHFREPGYPLKGTIYSESRAAAAGGITSFMDMPNTVPAVTSREVLEKKFEIASRSSAINYSFFMGIDNNLDELLRIDNTQVCGLSDDGLYLHKKERPSESQTVFLENLLSRTTSLVALHCEDHDMIQKNEQFYRKQFGDDIPLQFHPYIRNERACLAATQEVVDVGRKHGSRIHILHISASAEADLLKVHDPLRSKRITGEVCLHHLWFSSKDYPALGAKIKWNPAVKSERHKMGLLTALRNKKLDIVATDHAPHLWSEKSGNYFQCKSGGPLVRHTLVALLEFCHQQVLTIPEVVEKTSHNVAELYRIPDRGYIKEGYYADLVLVDLNKPWISTQATAPYQCGWSPFENKVFQSKVVMTMVNGKVVFFENGICENGAGKRLLFEGVR